MLDLSSERITTIEPAPRIKATPYTWVNEQDIPARDYLLGKHLIRGYASSTVAAGGVGKTSLRIVEALVLVTGKDLLGRGHNKPSMRVWLWNLEDTRDELVRRIQAAAKHYRLKPKDLLGLFVDTGREQECIIAETTRSGAVILHPVVDNIVEELVDNQIDVLILDPFVSTHRVAENDNGATDLVAKKWNSVAGRANCAIDLIHHARKMANGEKEITTESSRGAKALTDACRSVMVLNRMTEEDGEKAGVENHRLYFKTYIDKGNMAPPAEKSDWYQLVGVHLENGPASAGGLFGDNVGVATAWEWPNAFDDVEVHHLRAVQTKVAAGQWRQNSQAAEWVGIPVAEVLRLDLSLKVTRAKVASLLKAWIGNRMFKIVDGEDKNRKKVKFVEVDQWASD